MTPEELSKLFAEEARTNKSQKNIEDYFLLHLKQAKTEWCREQRENCVARFAPLDEREKAIYKGILNAPEPK